MADVERNAIRGTVTREAVDYLERPGPFVLMHRVFDDGKEVNDWFHPAEALKLAEDLIRAARS